MRNDAEHRDRDASPLISLQVLRAVAALMVVVHHAGYDADTLANRAGRPSLALDRGFDWTFGIHLFFVISGFIMLRTARGFGSASGAARFALRRVIRVVPLYWLLTSLVLLGAAFAPGLLNVPLGGIGVIVGSYAFVPVFRADGAINPVLGQGWTLDFEMFFYALFAGAMLLPRRFGLAVLGGMLIGLVILGRWDQPGGAPSVVWTGELLLEFLFGMAVGLAQERGARLPAPATVVIVLIGAAAIVASGPLAPSLAGVSPLLRAGVPATLIVAGSVLGPRWPPRPLVLAAASLGDASYSLYLSHPFVIRTLREAWRAIVPDAVPLGVFAVLACAASVPVAILLHRCIERPITNALQRRLKAGRRPILPEVALGDG